MIFKTAIDLAQNGYAVFPLIESSKVPAVSHGFKEASKDLKIIKKWFETCESFNIGIATGQLSGITVVDVDVKNGHRGNESLKFLNLPPTLTAKTPSGGWHLYYKYHPGLRSSIGGLDGIDVKTDGGYVVAPPSTLPDGPYEWVNDHEISSLEDVHVQKLSPKKIYAKKEEGALIEANRNNTLTSLAGAMRRQGATEEEIYHALTKVNDGRCSPPLEDFEVRGISRSVSKYQPSSTPQNAEGARNLIISELQRIDEKYAPWQDTVWNEMKTTSPTKTEALLVSRDSLDEEYGKFKTGKGSLDFLKTRIKEYENKWHELTQRFPL